MGRILNAAPDLYSEIQAYNLQAPALLQAYLDAAQALGRALIAGNVEAFKESMTASAVALGPAYLAALLQKSHIGQRHLVERASSGVTSVIWCKCKHYAEALL